MGASPQTPEVYRIAPKAKLKEKPKKVEAGRHETAQLRFRTWRGARVAPQQEPYPPAKHHQYSEEKTAWK